MSEHGCSTCGGPVPLPLGKEKWGRCAPCISLAAAGAITGWSFTLSFRLLSPRPGIVMGLAALSVLFSLVLLGHVVVYLLRSRPGGQP